MELKTYILLAHLLGLVVGLGAVTTLDIYLVRFFRGAIVTAHDADLIDLVSMIAMGGLIVLWLSGLGFLALYLAVSPENLSNPKIHAKFFIVCVLTINGFVLHKRVLPSIHRAIGRPLFAQQTPIADRLTFRLCGAVSLGSWWTPFILGTVRELNFTFSMGVLLAVYGCILVVAGLVMLGLEHVLARERPAPFPAKAGVLHGRETLPPASSQQGTP